MSYPFLSSPVLGSSGSPTPNYAASAMVSVYIKTTPTVETSHNMTTSGTLCNSTTVTVTVSIRQTSKAADNGHWNAISSAASGTMSSFIAGSDYPSKSKLHPPKSLLYTSDSEPRPTLSEIYSSVDDVHSSQSECPLPEGSVASSGLSSSLSVYVLRSVLRHASNGEHI
jgi:hypothetical protein